MIAEIVINITAKQLTQTFSYCIPPQLDIHIGARVLVPFGHRTEEGIVVAVHADSEMPRDYIMKPIIKVLSLRNGFREEMIDTAMWISDYYLCSLSDALRLFMIDKKGIITKKFITLGSNDSVPANAYQKIIDYVKTHLKVERNKLLSICSENEIDFLLNENYLHEESCSINKIADKTDTWLVWKKNDTEQLLKNRRRQIQLLADLAIKKGAPISYWSKKGYSHQVIQGLVATGLASVEKHLKNTMDLTHHLAADTPWTLTKDQQKAVQVISSDKNGHTYVLHGVTGSGKTEVYMDLTQKVLAKGQQVIVLVPEIALTGQIVRRFIRRFGNDVVVQHSKLSHGERQNNWLRMLNKESHICIGARSAIFTAVSDIGLIIIDEAHDSSYKQDESPRYEAVEVARRRAAYYHCPVILGSATPAINHYYRALQGTYKLLELPDRVAGRALPTVSIVDMREELANRNYSVLSHELSSLLKETLDHHHQAIILLNRRGFSTFVMCRKCGYVVKCETCDVAMVYHKDRNVLKCHYCDNEKPVPTVCPSCGSKYIKYFGTGTQKVEEQLHEAFPDARIIRLDQDTTSRKNSSDQIIEAFRNHAYDILLGTQMVAKGHDFPDVSTVGILSADSLLNLPVYWAGERTFQLLTQAAGRAGRGTIPGKVIMQTYAPEHYVIKCSAEQDYQAFYSQEIEYRKELLYPPFQHIIKIVVTYENEKDTWNRAIKLTDLLHTFVTPDCPVEIIGPYVDTIKLLRNKYRVTILLKGTQLESIKKCIKYEPEFYKTGIIIDVDPTF